MKEQLHHQGIFDIYYSMGETRSLQKLREQLHQDSTTDTPSIDTLKRWSKAFSWQERIEQRDMELSKKLEQKTNNTIVNEKANYRKIIKAAIGKFVKNLQEGKVDVATVRDAERLVKLDLLLMGEDTGKSTVDVSVKPDYSRLSDEELKTVVELGRKATGDKP